MKTAAFVLLFCCTLLMSLSRGHAAKIEERWNSDFPWWLTIFVFGEIKPGDLEKIKGRYDLYGTTPPAIINEGEWAEVQAYGTALRRQRIPVLPETVRMARFFGVTSTSKLLTAPPGTPIESILSEDAIEANPILKGKTNTWAVQWARGQTEDQIQTHNERIDERLAKLNEKEPGRYRSINEDELPAWQEQWKKEHNGKLAADRAQIAFDVCDIHVDSDGGDLMEAMRIGHWLRQKKCGVTVGSFDKCASACVFILGAGVRKTVYEYGDVVIHRPYLTRTPAGDVGANLREMLNTVRDYLSEMNIPPTLADEMFSIRPEDGVVLSEADLSRYRLNVDDFAYAEERDLRQAEKLGISRTELIRRRQTYNEAIGLGACPDKEYLGCIEKLETKHGLRPSR